MKQKNHRFCLVMISRAFWVISIFFVGFIISNSNKNHINSVSNVNTVKSIEAIHIISKYDNKDKQIPVRQVSNMKEASLYGKEGPIAFTGQMTAYNPVCIGCTGKVYCPPRQDVRNGNIYFKDNTYGKIRILAADSAIPCGTIVQITNLSFSKVPIIGIVLDRGGAIKGNIMDFLVTENDDMNVVGRQKNVKYEILRWGW